MDGNYPSRGPRRFNSGNRGQGQGNGYARTPASYGPPRERVPDEVLGERVLETERKVIKITRRRNAGGEILRIEESRKGSSERPHLVIVPAEEVERFFDAVEDLFPAPEPRG